MHGLRRLDVGVEGVIADHIASGGIVAHDVPAVGSDQSQIRVSRHYSDVSSAFMAVQRACE